MKACIGPLEAFFDKLSEACGFSYLGFSITYLRGADMSVSILGKFGCFAVVFWTAGRRDDDDDDSGMTAMIA